MILCSSIVIYIIKKKVDSLVRRCKYINRSLSKGKINIEAVLDYFIITPKHESCKY